MFIYGVNFAQISKESHLNGVQTFRTSNINKINSDNQFYAEIHFVVSPQNQTVFVSLKAFYNLTKSASEWLIVPCEKRM